MDKFLDFLNGFNLQTMIMLGVMMWYFSRDMKAEMAKLEAKIDRQAERSDRLYEMFIDLLKEKKHG